jgi:CTP:molybdopterin cytidylyltransferase MocA
MDAPMNPTLAGPAPAAGTRRVHDARRHRRLARELRTLSAMMGIYCHDLHGEDDGLCESCAALLAYATRRLDRCVFGDDKPTCAKCTVHCYSAKLREHVRVVMRYAGPRMIWRHPVLAVRHLIDGRRPAPALSKPSRG